VEGGVPALWTLQAPGTAQTTWVDGAMVYEVTVKRLLAHMDELPEQWAALPVKVGHIRNGEFVANLEVVIPAGQESAPVTDANLINFAGTALTYQASNPVAVTAMVASVDSGYSVGVPGALALSTPILQACHYNDTANLIDAI
jgi:hypothetical protein